jgi:hypothetical protein
MKSIQAILFYSIILFSCNNENELEFSNLHTEPGYFIECYLLPDDVYKLSATKIKHISEDYILDYSLDFTVYIDSIRLLQGLFKEQSSNYIYNYGSAETYIPDGSKHAYIKVISPRNDTITGKTTIPESVFIEELSLSDDVVKVNFETSENCLHNFYIVNFNTLINDSVRRDAVFYDYSHINKRVTEEIRYKIKKNIDFDMIEIQLRRVTKENYRYQISLWNANNANNDNLTIPAPLDGNLINAMGIFTCYTEDIDTIKNMHQENRH